MATYTDDIDAKEPTQKERATPDQIRNRAGGFVFKVDNWTQLDRFLILGTAGGTYYASQREMTRENVDGIKACLAEDGKRAVDRIAEISDGGRAPKNDPAILALALALSCEDPLVRAHAAEAVPHVCRIGTHILALAAYIDSLRGWGRTARRAIHNWFRSKDSEALGYQAIKYKSRDGWSLRDLLRLSHYTAKSERRRSVLEYIAHPEKGTKSVDQIEASRLLASLEGFDAKDKAAALISQHRLPREIVPTELLNEVVVWEALLESMPMTALIRNLGKMSSIGLIKPMGANSKEIAGRINNEEALKRARVHPLTLLVAYAQYKEGAGLRGSLSWSPDKAIVDALEEAYYKSFAFVEPTGLRYYIGLDVSGSMGQKLANSPITCAQAVGCLASVISAVEPQTYTVAFAGPEGAGWSSRNVATPVTLPKRSLGQGLVMAAFGNTDCALPMLDAMKNGIEADVFIVMTDNETWAGDVHPNQALSQYRHATGIDAKLVVVAMTATECSIADPNDAGMIDMVGFDVALPQAIAEFTKM